MKKEINLVHVWYWIGYLILIISCIATLFFVSDADLVISISFAASIVSIIIGIIAVFITVYQGLTQSTSVEKMQDASDRVESVTKSLEKLGSLNEKIERIDKSLYEADFKTIHKKLGMLNYSKQNVLIDGVSEGFKIDLSMEDFFTLFSLMKVESTFNYYVLKCHLNNRPVDIEEYIRFLLNQNIIEGYDKRTAITHVGLLTDHIIKYDFIAGFDIDEEYYVKEIPSYFSELTHRTINAKDKEKIDDFFTSI
ncbi:hypothetical protein J26TS2_12840 [Shouchella clausii]|nr:hypothetical protein J26TS2_12840 [Shouchella clausii]